LFEKEKGNKKLEDKKLFIDYEIDLTQIKLYKYIKSFLNSRLGKQTPRRKNSIGV
jgi:hypothetical protein